MGNFSGKIDLNALAGAKFLKGIDAGNPEQGYICIPVNKNCIAVDNYNDRLHVNLPIYMKNYDDSYYKAARERAKRQGEEFDEMRCGSHSIQVNISKEARERAFPVAIERVKQEHPEWANEDFETSQNRDFKNAVYRFFDMNIGKMYVSGRPVNQQQTGGYNPQSAAGAQQAEYTPSQNDSNGNPYSPEEDLPF